MFLNWNVVKRNPQHMFLMLPTSLLLVQSRYFYILPEDMSAITIISSTQIQLKFIQGFNLKVEIIFRTCKLNGWVKIEKLAYFKLD